MPNIASMKKDLRRNAKRHLRNKSTCAALKTYAKKVRTAATAGAADLGSILTLAISNVDKAHQRGIIHKNAAARKKSRLMRAVNKAAAAAQPSK
jgi:small subunit ribosomal protein S20